MTPRPPAGKFGRPAPPALGSPEPMEPKAKPAAPPKDDAPSGGLVTLDMLDYHDESERCDACQNYTAPDQCAVDPSTPVTAGGHCEAFKGADGQGTEEGASEGETPDEL